MRPPLLPACLLLLCACPATTDPPPPRDSGRCEVPLEGTGLFPPAVGTGARAAVLAAGEPLPGGPRASGRPGDVLLVNDRLRVVIRQPGQTAGPLPFGGVLVDADLARAAGEPGKDQLGGLGLLTAFGRTADAQRVEVLSSGEGGGMAVVAATGPDALLASLALGARLEELLGEPGRTLVLDPQAALPLRSTTYFVLSPGEARVRMLTALCNTGNTPATLPLGDLLEPDGALEPFNPSGCTGALGPPSCAVDTAGVLGFQGDGVAYGYRTYRLADARLPEAESTLLSIDGLSLVVAGGRGRQSLLAWTDPQVTERPGTVVVPGGGQALFLRDLFVTRDLAELHSVLLALDNLPRSRLAVTVVEADGAAAPGARVQVVAPATDRLVTLLVTDARGVGRVDLEPGGYHLRASTPGRTGQVTRDVSIASTGTHTVTLTLPAE